MSAGYVFFRSVSLAALLEDALPAIYKKAIEMIAENKQANGDDCQRPDGGILLPTSLSEPDHHRRYVSSFDGRGLAACSRDPHLY